MKKEKKQSNPASGPSMRWHNIQLVLLWVKAFYTLAFGVFMVGSTDVFSLVMGVDCIALAAFVIWTWFSLADRKAHGPKRLILSNVAQLAVFLFLVIFLPKATQGQISFFDGLSSILGVIGICLHSVAVIFLNKAYYDKRTQLFGV